MKDRRGVLRIFGFVLSLLTIQGCFLIKPFLKTQPVVSFKQRYYAHPEEMLGGNAVVYIPKEKQLLSHPESNLLNQFAPLLIQGIQSPGSAKYANDSDEIASPMLSKEKEISITLDTKKPAMFCRIEQEMLGDAQLTQLVYVFWYPRHPVGGVQAGSIDGGVLRITLDAAKRPAVFEYSQPCGCYHGVFTAEHLEVWAKEEFKQREKGKRRFTEKSVNGKTDWVVRDIVGNGHKFLRPVLWVSAAEHHCLAIQIQDERMQLGHLPEIQYALQDYQSLENIPVLNKADEKASMFNDKGLVWGGRRPGEEWVFIGMDNPGWPRHLDKMKIHFDEANWTDSALLSQFLRLPKNMATASAHASAYKDDTTAPNAPALKESKRIADLLQHNKPVAILVTHAFCNDCQEFKKNVLADAKSKQALSGWSWLVVDMAEDEGKEIGDLAGVSMTPTLVLLDTSGKEINRVDGIGTLEEFQKALRNK